MKNAEFQKKKGRVDQGISAPALRRTVHEPLNSHQQLLILINPKLKANPEFKGKTENAIRRQEKITDILTGIGLDLWNGSFFPLTSV